MHLKVPIKLREEKKGFYAMITINVIQKEMEKSEWKKKTKSNNQSLTL